MHGQPTGHDEAEWERIFPERFPMVSRHAAVCVKTALDTFEPDAVYVHKLSDLQVLRALLGHNVPLVRMVHDHDLYCMRGYKYDYFTRKICRRAASPFCLIPCGAFIARDSKGPLPFRWVSYAAKKKEINLNKEFNKLVVATEYMKEELVRNGFEPGRIEIHAPVPPAVEGEQQANFSERNRIVYAGQIIRGKGVDVLLEALAQVQTPFECFILGDGNHRSYCEDLSRRLGLGARVRFTGFVPQEKLRHYFREATVMVVSSVWPEPFGAVGLEGMRWGLPVVAFDAGGIREWLTDGDNGFLAPWMDSTQMAARVDQLLRDKSLARKMGERGRLTVTRDFGFSQYISDLEQMFVRLVMDLKQEACS